MNKNNFEKQIARLERQQATLRAMEEGIERCEASIEEEDLPLTKPEDHHYISQMKREPENLLKWTDHHKNNPAIKACSSVI